MGRKSDGEKIGHRAGETGKYRLQGEGVSDGEGVFRAVTAVGTDFAGGDLRDHNQLHAGLPPHLHSLRDAGGRTVARRNHFHCQHGNQTGDVAAIWQRTRQIV